MSYKDASKAKGGGAPMSPLQKQQVRGSRTFELSGIVVTNDVHTGDDEAANVALCELKFDPIPAQPQDDPSEIPMIANAHGLVGAEESMALLAAREREMELRQAKIRGHLTAFIFSNDSQILPIGAKKENGRRSSIMQLQQYSAEDLQTKSTSQINGFFACASTGIYHMKDCDALDAFGRMEIGLCQFTPVTIQYMPQNNGVVDEQHAHGEVGELNNHSHMDGNQQTNYKYGFKLSRQFLDEQHATQLDHEPGMIARKSTTRTNLIHAINIENILSRNQTQAAAQTNTQIQNHQTRQDSQGMTNSVSPPIGCFPTGNVAFFIADSLADYNEWKTALENIVVQTTRINQVYHIKEVLGEGTFGQVMLGTPKQLIPFSRDIENDVKNSDTNIVSGANEQEKQINKVAIKILNKSKIIKQQTGLRNLINEIKVHWALDLCENVLRLLQIFEDVTFIYLVLEFQPKGTLLDMIEDSKQILESTTRIIMEQVLLALDFFHKKKIIHRDIKLDNILINQIQEGTHYEIRIADFGLAAFTLKDEYITHRCGSPGYVAPEVLKGRPYSYKADIFGAGSVFFNLLSRRYLFSGATAEEVLRRNARCQVDHIRKYLEQVSNSGQDLLFWMLQSDPDRRPTAAEALQHEWFRNDQKIINDLLSVNNVICSQQQVMGDTSQISDNKSGGSYLSFIASFQMGTLLQYGKHQNQFKFGHLNQRNASGVSMCMLDQRGPLMKDAAHGHVSGHSSFLVGQHPTPTLHDNNKTPPIEVCVSQKEKGTNPSVSPGHIPTQPPQNRSVSSSSMRVSYFKAIRESNSINARAQTPTPPNVNMNSKTIRANTSQFVSGNILNINKKKDESSANEKQQQQSRFMMNIFKNQQTNGESSQVPSSTQQNQLPQHYGKQFTVVKQLNHIETRGDYGNLLGSLNPTNKFEATDQNGVASNSQQNRFQPFAGMTGTPNGGGAGMGIGGPPIHHVNTLNQKQSPLANSNITYLASPLQQMRPSVKRAQSKFAVTRNLAHSILPTNSANQQQQKQQTSLMSDSPEVHFQRPSGQIPMAGYIKEEEKVLRNAEDTGKARMGLQYANQVFGPPSPMHPNQLQQLHQHQTPKNPMPRQRESSKTVKASNSADKRLSRETPLQSRQQQLQQNFDMKKKREVDRDNPSSFIDSRDFASIYTIPPYQAVNSSYFDVQKGSIPKMMQMSHRNIVARKRVFLDQNQ